MKISIEYKDIPEVEVIVSGHSTDAEILKVINALHQVNTDMNTEEQIVGMLNDAKYILTLDTILFFEVESEITYAVTKDERYRIKQRLYEIHDLVADRKFIQISKWCIANIKKIEKVELGINATMTVFFKESDKQQILTRSYMKQFKNTVLGG